MSESGVSYSVSAGIAHIALNRPPVNALSLETIRTIVAALRHAAADNSARAVVLRSGVPHRFCAGLDLTLLLGKSSEEVRDLLRALYVDLHDAQYDLGKPSIAAVNGAARGGGMTLAISCDVILAGEGATFGYPEINIGVLPAIHFAHLPRIAGRHRAFELLFSGRSFDAREARDIGLVSKVVPDAQLDAEADSLAAEFAAKSPTVMRLGRAAFMRQNDLDYRRSIANAVEDFCNIVTTEAAQEGIRAFVEKRPPNW
jgi:enoyl-CoA hydratase/carnithine racemase